MEGIGTERRGYRGEGSRYHHVITVLRPGGRSEDLSTAHFGPNEGQWVAAVLSRELKKLEP